MKGLTGIEYSVVGKRQKEEGELVIECFKQPLEEWLILICTPTEIETASLVVTYNLSTWSYLSHRYR